MIKESKIKVLDTKNNKSMINANVEIINEESVRGNVEVKIYKPSLNKTKGATLELRKLSGHEFDHVESLKDIIKYILNEFVNG